MKNNNNSSSSKKKKKVVEMVEEDPSSSSSESDSSSSDSEEEEEVKEEVVKKSQQQQQTKKKKKTETVSSPSKKRNRSEEEEEDDENSSSGSGSGSSDDDDDDGSSGSDDDDDGSSSSENDDDKEEKKESKKQGNNEKQKTNVDDVAVSSKKEKEQQQQSKAMKKVKTNETKEDDDKSKSTTTTNDKDDNNNNEDSGSSSVVTETTFEKLGVCEPLVEACTTAGWKTATRIQKEVLPYALKGRDIIGLAETGSGKTGAFTLPLLQALLESPPARGAVFGLILTPTRELAFQIHQVVQALSGTIGATSLCIVGGVDKTSQSIALARTPHVLIATPGRLVDHLTNTKGFHLRKLRYLILDEADRMLSLDFEEELNQILDVIPDSASGGRRTMLFSATMTSKVQKLQRASLTNPVKLEVSTKFSTPKQLLQSYLFIPAKYKDCYLTWLIHEHIGKSILVFGATCNNVQRLALMLRNLGFDGAVCLHGQMSQPKRLGALQKFTAGDRNILICTDVASRGLDIPSVDVVINFDLPGHGKDYIHRVGRTARAGKSGKAIAMVTQYDVEVYQRLETLLGKKLPEYNLSADEETVLVLLERVSEAQRIATRELKEQLAARKTRDGGRRKQRGGRGGGDDDYGDGGDEDGIQNVIQKQLKKGYYAGGSGGRGGALPNQRGYGGGGGKHKKKQRR